MKNKFIITEQEKTNIRKLYNLSEESTFEKILSLAFGQDKSSTEEEPSSEPEMEKIDNDDDEFSISEVEGLNSNEKIVLNQLKKDGYTDEAAAAVMGIVGGESDFQHMEIDSFITTSNSRLKLIFPTKLGKLSDSELNKIKESDKKFFDYIYGGMYGNAKDEGYKYRDRGFNGITFKANYEAAQSCTGIGFVSDPDLMLIPENAAKALSCYFKSLKDSDDIESAIRDAYVLNAGPGNSWEFYSTTKNPVHQKGTTEKPRKAREYYKKITT
jgi:predicted chitinase